MHLLSNLKQHVVSAKSNNNDRHLSLKPRGKRQQQPSIPPAISIKTADISWPLGSGSGGSGSSRPDDYDFLDSCDIRSPGILSASLDIRRDFGVTEEEYQSLNNNTFPLSRHRALSGDVSSAYPKTFSLRPRRAGTTESLESGVLFPSPPSPKVNANSQHYATANNSMPFYQRRPATASPYQHSLDYLASPPPPPQKSSVFSSHSSIISTVVSTSPTHSKSTTAPAAVTASTSAGLYSRRKTSSSMGSPTATSIHSNSSSTARSYVRQSSALAVKRERDSRSSANDDEDINGLRGPPPRDDWDIVFDRIREYRATHEAPVDTVGCEALTEEEKDPKLRRFRSLISLMLSAQTKDEITAEAVRTLSQRLQGGLTPKALSEAPIDLIHECVRRVGFWQRKSNYIKEAARTCLEQYDGDIPRTVPQLLSLPGVGPKMAYLAMHAAWQDSQGIGVDTHVLRISHRLGWVDESAKSPEATRHSLESWLPKSLWREINPLLVGLGQTVCRGVGPKCEQCPVNQYCPSSLVARKGDVTVPSSGLGSSKGGENRKQQQRRGDRDDSSELSNVDVEDIAHMVRGAEQAVRSRKSSGGGRGRRKGVAVKTEFPVVPDSPSSKTKFVYLEEDEQDDIKPNNSKSKVAARARSRTQGSQHYNLHNSSYREKKGLVEEEEEEEEEETTISNVSTEISSPYFTRSRSNAASEDTRPEAKTDTVLSARAKVKAEKSYSRRLSVSDMQWALGEDWDPDDNSSLSSLSDGELNVTPNNTD